MELAIVGAGNVGSALAKNFGHHGHKVKIGVRHPKDKKYADLKDELGGKVQLLTIKKATENATIIFLTVPWASVDEVLEEMDLENDAILVDCTNPLTENLTQLIHPDGLSGAEQIQKKIPDVKVFKSFNHTGAKNLEEPMLKDGRPVMFVAGDHKGKKEKLLKLIEDIHFKAVDAGQLNASVHLERMALFWIHLAYKCNLGDDIAFSLIQR